MPQVQQLQKWDQHVSGRLGKDHFYAGSGVEQLEEQEHSAQRAVEGRCKERSGIQNGHHHEKVQHETVPSAPLEPQDSSALYGG